MIDMIPRTTVDVGDDELKAIERVIKRKQFVKGVECQFLEEEFSKYQGVKFGAAVNSGTSALHLALIALGVLPGDEVITVPNTFAATINAIILIGAKPKFVDINPKSFNIDTTKINKAITKKTKVILPVHLYGLMADMKPIMEIAEDSNMFVLEDACQAHGAEYYGQKAGMMGDAAAFSFFPTKNVTVGGDGGIVLSNDNEIIEKIKILRDHGRKNGVHTIAGFNNRLSEILAAIGREHLKKLESFNEHRRKIAQLYDYHLGDNEYLKLPREPDGFKHVYHLYTMRVARRDHLQEHLKKYQIFSKVMYRERLNELDYVVNLVGKQSTPNNDEVNTEILSLPTSGTLSFDKVDSICEKVLDFF